MVDSTNSEHSSQPIVYHTELQKDVPSKTSSKYNQIASQSVDLDAAIINKENLESPRSENNVQMTGFTDMGPMDDEQSPNAPPLDEQYVKGVCYKLFTDCLCWLRIFVVSFNVLLLLLSISYCMGQLIDTKLDIITECPEPKTREEIWAHSYEAYTKNGNIMNDESQFGYTNDSCWTTRKIEVNTDQLWYHNQYILQSKTTTNTYYILFGLIFIYLAIIILYNVISFIIDIVMIKHNKMHTKSSLYTKYLSLRYNQKNVNDESKKCYNTLYDAYLRNDTTGWIMVKLAGEWTEFIIQSLVLFLYNGYNVFDPNNENDVYLANKPEIIITFASILAFNYFGSGFLWLLYSLCPNCCYGVLFNRSIFFIDIVSDFCYALFPFYMYFRDDYNKNTNNVQLQINSSLVFASVFVPLLFLGNKCFIMSVTIRDKMRDKYFLKWKNTTENDMSNALQHFQSLGYTFNATPIPNNGDINLSINNDQKNWIYHDDDDDDDDDYDDGDDDDDEKQCSKTKILNQMLIILVSLFFIGFGCIVLIYTLNHFESSEEYCHSIIETKYESINNLTVLSEEEIKIFLENPELYLWDKCLYKVYPFVNDNEFKCQCRIFVVNWNNLLNITESERRTYFNLSQEMILNGILNHWYMLERFHTFGNVEDASQIIFRLKSSMYKSVHLKAFDWRDINIGYIEDGISAWNELEYLAFISTSFIGMLPSDFGDIQSIQYLILENNGLNKIPESICDLTKLRVLKIEHETDIESLPHCMSKMNELKAIWFDVTGLKQIPLSIFNLPKLLELSLFVGNIDFYHLLDYNNISIQINDTLKMNEWFNNNFKYNQYTDYWLTLNPICNEIQSLPSKLQYFINETCLELCPYSYSNICPPRLLGDGQCNKGCQTTECYWDYGDCSQLCFNTDCTFNKFINNQCDDQCDNHFCAQDINHCVANYTQL